ncbi:hypothetical protein [Streptomyces chartreusis]|uniref:Uncharacterized protein n=1 Tax=Streptomyces chartreusis TaxID=1969 RepID=A0A7I0Y8Y1_STRCX|nr:hypothetical protein [Streptomyces chartreusis]QKZ15962.1 hypothetical protein HUT05_00185 [Streptomyces chartreusis]
MLLETENGWADPDTEGLPSESLGAPAGRAALSGAETAAADEVAADRVAVVRGAEAAEDTSAWDAADPVMLWAPGGRRTEEEEEEELLPTYVLSDDEGWSDEDDAVSEAGVAADVGDKPVEESGWNDEEDAAFAAALGLLPPAAAESTSAASATGPVLATWRRDRSQAEAAEEVPIPVSGYAGMLLSTADLPDDEEDEQAEDMEEDGDEAKSSRGIADLLRQGSDSWGVVRDEADALG